MTSPKNEPLVMRQVVDKCQTFMSANFIPSMIVVVLDNFERLNASEQQSFLQSVCEYSKIEPSYCYTKLECRDVEVSNEPTEAIKRVFYDKYLVASHPV